MWMIMAIMTLLLHFLHYSFEKIYIDILFISGILFTLTQLMLLIVIIRKTWNKKI